MYIPKHLIHSNILVTNCFLDLAVVLSSGIDPKEQPKRSGRSSTMSTNSPRWILATILCGTGGRPAPMESGGWSGALIGGVAVVAVMPSTLLSITCT